MFPGRRVHGVTLIEISVTLTIFGLLIVAIGPQMGIWMQNLRIKSTAESVLTGMQQARLEAMRRNQNVRFTLVNDVTADCALSSTSSAWVISVDSPVGQCATALSANTTPRIVATRRAGDGNASVATSVRVAATRLDNAASSTVIFDGFGRVVGNEGISAISFDNSLSSADYRVLRIVVGAGGSIRMCEPAIAATSNDPRRC
jgi:type IV fimbrial biogenesis protein FimT